MNEQDYVKIDPLQETFRGYAIALDNEMEAGGSLAIPFIAFAKMSGANVDKVFVKEDFDKFMDETAAEFGAAIIKHDVNLPKPKIGFSAESGRSS